MRVAQPLRLGRVDTHSAYLAYRRRSVRGLILGLEFLVAADIIRTIIIDYTLNSLLMLGLIVLQSLWNPVLAARAIPESGSGALFLLAAGEIDYEPAPMLETAFS